MTNPYRSLPSVDRLLQHSALDGVRREIPSERLTAYGRAALQQARDAIGDTPGSRPDGAPPAFSIDGLAAAVLSRVQYATRPTLHPVINASGVILHTNLGRAPLSEATRAAMSAAGVGYSNLAFDLGGGGRGSRLDHLDRLLREVTGAEAGMAVNNNAAAVLLGLSALAAGREVIVSRGQAVEIGGGFRIPDVLRQSGAELVEVGTTNRTRAADYRNAMSERTAALLRVHTSNYKIVGFTEQPTLADLSAVASEAGALLLDDLGSGCLLDTARYGLAPEPTPAAELERWRRPSFFLRGQTAGRTTSRDHRGAHGPNRRAQATPIGASDADGQSQHRRAQRHVAALSAGRGGIPDPDLAHDRRAGGGATHAGGVVAGGAGGRRGGGGGVDGGRGVVAGRVAAEFRAGSAVERKPARSGSRSGCAPPIRRWSRALTTTPCSWTRAPCRRMRTRPCCARCAPPWSQRAAADFRPGRQVSYNAGNIRVSLKG